MASITTYSPLYIVPIATSAFLSGTIACFSLALVPSLVLHLRDHPSNNVSRATAESHTLSVFRHFTLAGVRVAPTIAVASASLCFGHAYRLYSVTTARSSRVLATWQYAIAAGVLNLAIVPFTFLVIGSTNKQLFAREEAAKIGGAGSQGGGEKLAAIVKREGGVRSEALFARWMWLNFARAALPAAGAVAAWMAC